VCGIVNRQCLNIDECVYETDDCADSGAVCQDTDGSHICTCDEGYTGDGKTCSKCTICGDGFFETDLCTRTTDTVCEMIVPSGVYYVTTEADDTPKCLSSADLFPARMNYCSGGSDCSEDVACGLSVSAGKSAEDAIVQMPSLQWKLEHLRADMYTISSLSSNGVWECLMFANYGHILGGALYPSQQNCEDEDDACPWGNAGNELCGFEAADGEDQLEALIQNKQAVWKIVPLDLVHHDEDRHGGLLASYFLLENDSRRDERFEMSMQGQTGHDLTDEGKTVDRKDECLVFADGGSATNPKRYNWGNGDEWCGIRVFDATSTKQEALLENKQAVFGLHLLHQPERASVAGELLALTA